MSSIEEVLGYLNEFESSLFINFDKDKEYIIELSLLGKQLTAWHMQRHNLSYGETKIFDKIEQMFYFHRGKAREQDACWFTCKK